MSDPFSTVVSVFEFSKLTIDFVIKLKGAYSGNDTAKDKLQELEDRLINLSIVLQNIADIPDLLDRHPTLTTSLRSTLTAVNKFLEKYQAALADEKTAKARWEKAKLVIFNDDELKELHERINRRSHDLTAWQASDTHRRASAAAGATSGVSRTVTFSDNHLPFSARQLAKAQALAAEQQQQQQQQQQQSQNGPRRSSIRQPRRSDTVESDAETLVAAPVGSRSRSRSQSRSAARDDAAEQEADHAQPDESPEPSYVPAITRENPLYGSPGPRVVADAGSSSRAIPRAVPRSPSNGNLGHHSPLSVSPSDQGFIAPPARQPARQRSYGSLHPTRSNGNLIQNGLNSVPLPGPTSVAPQAAQLGTSPTPSERSMPPGEVQIISSRGAFIFPVENRTIAVSEQEHRVSWFGGTVANCRGPRITGPVQLEHSVPQDISGIPWTRMWDKSDDKTVKEMHFTPPYAQHQIELHYDGQVEDLVELPRYIFSSRADRQIFQEKIRGCVEMKSFRVLSLTTSLLPKRTYRDINLKIWNFGANPGTSASVTFARNADDQHEEIPLDCFENLRDPGDHPAKDLTITVRKPIVLDEKPKSRRGSFFKRSKSESSRSPSARRESTNSVGSLDLVDLPEGLEKLEWIKLHIEPSVHRKLYNYWTLLYETTIASRPASLAIPDVSSPTSSRPTPSSQASPVLMTHSAQFHASPRLSPRVSWGTQASSGGPSSNGNLQVEGGFFNLGPSAIIREESAEDWTQSVGQS